MTVLVGISCEDGVVIGSDSSATYGQLGGRVRTIEHEAFKIEIINGEMITAATGAVGLAQRANHVITRAHTKKQFQMKYSEELGVKIHNIVVEEFNKTASPRQVNTTDGWGLGMLVGISVAGQPTLIEFDTQQFHPEIKGLPDPDRGDRIGRFVSMGTGQIMADPFLADAYDMLFEETPPTVQRAKLAIVWTLQRVIKYNTGSIGGPLRLAVLQSDGKGGWKADHEDPGEILQHVELLRRHIAEFDPKAGVKKIDLDKALK